MVKKIERHVFVCTNERADGHPRGCCSAKKSSELLMRLKELVKDRRPALKTRVQRAGCLDLCEKGAVIVVYPEAVWYGKVELEDAEEIVESHLIGNKPVERLMIFD